MKAVLDTRFFLLHFLSPDEQSKKWTRTTLENLQRRTNIGAVPSIVIHEFYKFELENLGKDIADIRVNSILKSNLNIIDLDPTIAKIGRAFV